jgi:hypothetical protein
MVSSMAISTQSCFRFCEGLGVAIIHKRTNLATGQIGKQKHLGIQIYFGDMLELRTFCLKEKHSVYEPFSPPKQALYMSRTAL